MSRPPAPEHGGAAGRMRRAASLPWTRGGLLAAATVPLLILTAAGGGLPATRVRMSGGGAWLASSALGYLTLLDGSSEQVVGSVRVPGGRAGDALTVTQAGSSAYVVDPAQGTVARVDGGTYDVSEAVRFGAGGGQPVSLFAGASSLYVVDGVRRTASVTDPVTLKVRQRLATAAQPGAGQAVVDGAGRLWVADSASTALSRLDGTGAQVRSDLGGADSRLVLVRGEPVLVDLAQHRAGRLDSAGRVPAWSCLEVRAADRPQLLGSESSGWVVAAVGASGTLIGANLDTGDCRLTVNVGSPGDDFGSPVQSGGYVFVPDRSTGRTAVVDLRSRQVDQLDVLKPGSRLELVAKDGMVFYNDAAGDLAGVIKLDGGQWRTGPALKKYQKADSGRGLLAPAGGDRPATDPPNKPEPPADTPQRPGGTAPTDPDPATPAPPGPPPPPGPPAPPGRLPPVPRVPPNIPVIGSLVATPANPELGQQVAFTADERVAGAAGAWTWSITTLGGSPVLAPTPAPALAPFNHRFTAVGSFRVTLTVAFAGHTGARSVDVTVTDQCALQGSASTIDFRTTAAADVRVSWLNCFAGQLPAVAVDPWLRAVTTTRSDGPGAGTLTARLTPDGGGPAPAEALQANAVRLTLAAQTVSVDAFPPVLTPPDAVTLTVISDRVATSLGSGSVSITESGAPVSGLAGAAAQDAYGPVSSVEVQQTVPGWTCMNLTTGERANVATEGAFSTLVTRPGASASALITVPDVPGQCPAQMVVDTAQTSFRARATGPGGTTVFTGEVHVLWRRQ